MPNTPRNSKGSTTPKGRPTARQGTSDALSPWADRWVTIQWALLGLAAVGAVVIAFILTDGQETGPLHGG
ncbi:MAG: hypothetical protein QNM02_14570 [Acidimicrobiia bacterium]|nr:hypothetical protein [Acidimicrobiia bacterium]